MGEAFSFALKAGGQRRFILQIGNQRIDLVEQHFGEAKWRHAWSNMHGLCRPRAQVVPSRRGDVALLGRGAVRNPDTTLSGGPDRCPDFGRSHGQLERL